MTVSHGVFVGYDDITDYVWDMFPPGHESDWNTALIVEHLIDAYPALIGWHAEVAKGPAIESLVTDEAFWAIANQHKYQ